MDLMSPVNEAELTSDYRAAMSSLIAELWQEVFRVLPRILDGNDRESVHDARVASRRLRVAMDAGAPLYPKRWYRKLHGEAKALTRTLGRVRDYEVLLQQLSSENGQSGGSNHLGRSHLRKRFRREWRREQTVMRKRLKHYQSRKFRKRIRRRFSEGEMSRHAVAVQGYAGSFVAQRIAGFLAFDARLAGNDSPELFHEARIAAKQVRYALELFGPGPEEERSACLGDLRQLQELLGNLHDLDVRIARLDAEVRTRSGKPRQAELVASLESVRASDRLTRIETHGQVMAAWREVMNNGLRSRLQPIAANEAR